MSASTSSIRRASGIVLLALLVALAGCGGGAGGASDAGAAPSGGSGGGGGNGGDSGGDGSDTASVGSYYDSDGDRVVVRSSKLRVRVENFERAFDRVQTVVDRYGGYLGDRSQDARGAWDRGEMTVRVPARNFSAVRDAFAALGRVETESVTAEDFTDAYRDREQRLADLRAEARRLREALNETVDPDEVEEVSEQLRAVRSERSELAAEQSSLVRRQSMSTITLRLHEPDRLKPPENRVTAAGLVDSFVEAFHAGMGVVEALVVVTGFFVPVGLALIPLGGFGVAALAAGRRTWPRVREVAEAPWSDEDVAGEGTGESDDDATGADDADG